MLRPDFAPLPADAPPPQPFEYAGTPHCPCGVPCVLRVDGRGTLAARSVSNGDREQQDEEEEVARGVHTHFWQCNAGSSQQGRTCGFFRPLDMQREGRGKWFRTGEGEGRS